MLVFHCHVVTCTAFLSLNAIKSALWVFKVLIILCLKCPRVSKGSPQPPLRWGFSLKGRKGEGVGKQQGREEENKWGRGGGKGRRRWRRETDEMEKEPGEEGEEE